MQTKKMATLEEKLDALHNAEIRLRSLADLLVDYDPPAAVESERQADIINEIIEEYKAKETKVN